MDTRLFRQFEAVSLDHGADPAESEAILCRNKSIEFYDECDAGMIVTRWTIWHGDDDYTPYTERVTEPSWRNGSITRYDENGEAFFRHGF